MNEGTNERTNEWMNEWVSAWICELKKRRRRRRSAHCCSGDDLWVIKRPRVSQFEVNTPTKLFCDRSLSCQRSWTAYRVFRSLCTSAVHFSGGADGCAQAKYSVVIQWNPMPLVPSELCFSLTFKFSTLVVGSSLKVSDVKTSMLAFFSSVCKWLRAWELNHNSNLC